MIILRIVDGVRKHFPVRASEWALGTILLLWGWLLTAPTDALDQPVFYFMRSVASEPIWSIACLVVGAIRLIALFINGTFADTAYSRYSPHVRAGMAALSSMFWGMIAVSILLGNPGAQGVAVYPILLALDMYNVFRSSGDAAHSDEAARNGYR